MRCSHSTPRRRPIFASRALSAVSRAGAREQAARQCSIVKTGSTHENRHVVCPRDPPDGIGGVTGVPSGRIRLDRINDINEVVRNAQLSGRRNLVGSDIKASIHGRRVTAHDFAADSAGQRETQGALARCRRPNDRDHPWPRSLDAHAIPAQRTTVRPRRIVSRITHPIYCVLVGGRMARDDVSETSIRSTGWGFVEVERHGKEGLLIRIVDG